MVRPKTENPRVKAANIRLTEEERAEIEAVSVAQGYSTLSEYFRALHTQATREKAQEEGVKKTKSRDFPAKLLRPFLESCN